MKLKRLTPTQWRSLSKNEAILYALVLVKQMPSKTDGICGHVLDVSDVFVVLPYAFASEWPKYSGNATFPVPDPNINRAWPRTAFDEAWKKETLWKGTYGKCRYELLDWLIVHYAKLVNKANEAANGW